MNNVIVKRLIEDHGEPAVSLLTPLDVQRPGNARDQRVLTELRDEAVDAITALLPAHDSAALAAQIDDAIGQVDLEHPSRGVAVLVAPGFARVLGLDATVEQKVVVGRTFATHALVSALQQHQDARVLVLAQGTTRCFDICGNEIVERLDHGFPVRIEPPTREETPHRDFPLDEHEHAEAAKFVFRAVENALTELQRRVPQPLVLVGAERDLAYFDEVTSWAAQVVGRVHGNHERATPTQIEELVRPVLAEYARAQQATECSAVREALGSKAVAGIDEVWCATHEGRARRLLVEDGYRFEARVIDGTLEPTPNDGPAQFDAVDDTIDGVLRHGGDVIAVPAGYLADLGHIAAFLRY